MSELTRREKLLEGQKLTRQLVALCAQKIITLTELDKAIDLLLADPLQWKKNDAAITAVHETLSKFRAADH